MNTVLIDKLVELTGKEKDTIVQILDGLSMEDMYELIDASNKNDDEKLMSIIDQHSVTEAMSKKKPQTSGNLPKPRDPMAKALAMPQYQAKVAPSKKEKLAKMDTKHKGRLADSIDASADAPITEGIMSMTGMPSLQRMMELAGRPIEDTATMEDMFSVPTTQMPDFTKFGVDTVPTGTRIIPGLVDLARAAGDLDDLEVPVSPDVEVEPEAEVELTAEPEVDLGAEFDQFMGNELETKDEVTSQFDGDVANIQAVRDSFEIIRSNLSQIRVSEFREVRDMLSDLMSQLDRLGNSITGK